MIQDSGLTKPPIQIEDLLEFLKLHRDFYNLEDPSLIDRVRHRLIIGGQKFTKIAKKIGLAALWLPDRNQILVDSSLPAPKQEWASFHDSVHTILPWHKAYFLGDTAQTLNPDFQEKLESEANCGGSGLMFCGKRFTVEALDTIPCWESIKILKNRYKKSWVTTLRRYVGFSHKIPLAMMVSTPNWEDKPDTQIYRWRHFIGSDHFLTQFACIEPESVLEEIDNNTFKRRGGPVGDFNLCLPDVNGDLHEFRAECFYNQHDILTFIVYKRPL
jgi:hypothetical protein